MRDSTPLLSVIIPCYNYEAFVGRAIESVLSQRHPQCELLVVDDGSSDRSWSVIQGYDLERCYRVANSGAARACLHAFERSRAPFVLFLDADDELAPGSLEEIVSRLEPGISKLQFPLTPIDENGAVLGPPVPRLDDFRDRDRLKREVARTGSYTSPPTSGNVFCRDVCTLLAEVDYEMSVDGVTLFAAPFLGDVVSVSKPLGFYRLHRHNYSQAGSRPTARRFRIEAERFLARHEHLERILVRRNDAVKLRDAKGLFFYRERRLYQKILEGDRVAASEILTLQWLAFQSPRPIPQRITMALFLGLCLILPGRLLGAVLDYRFRPGRRSAIGLLWSLLKGPRGVKRLLGSG